METKKKTIYELIPLIMGEISAIGKDRQNQQQGYKYRGVDDVMNELFPLFSKHGVFPVMEALGELHQEKVLSSNNKQGYHTTRMYKITLFAADGTSISGIHDGEAIDFGDKSIGKASSYAYRDFLLKTFVIPTDDPEGDPKDTDGKTHDLKSTPSAPSSTPTDNRPKATKVALDKLIARINNGELTVKGEAGEMGILEAAKLGLKLTPAQEKMINDAIEKKKSGK